MIKPNVLYASFISRFKPDSLIPRLSRYSAFSVSSRLFNSSSTLAEMGIKRSAVCGLRFAVFALAVFVLFLCVRCV